MNDNSTKHYQIVSYHITIISLSYRIDLMNHEQPQSRGKV